MTAIAVLVLLMIQNRGINRPNQSGEPLIVYCAAGMKLPVAEVALAYEKEYNIPVHLQYGGSGTLLNNLIVAKAGDLYLAADNSFIEIARAKNLVEESLPLAELQPVLAVAKGNPKGIYTVRDILREDVRTSMGNPDAASIGKQAKKLLIHSGVWEDVNKSVIDRGVFKPTVNEVANDIKIGAVDAGIIWDAVERQYDSIESVQIPGAEELGTEVTIGVLTFSKQPTEALRFMRYLGARDRGLRVFDTHGYKPVDGDVWDEYPEIVLFSGAINRSAIEMSIREFENREGVRINRVYNGCGILVGQMKTGELPDAYLACDISFLTQVKDLFLDSTDMSETDIVIVVQKDNPHNIQSLKDLAKGGIKIGVANAKQSALGALTVRLLESGNLLEPVMKNVRSQTPTADMLVNQLRSSSLDAVIVYAANVALVSDRVTVVTLDSPNARAVQPIAVSRESEQKYLTKRLLEKLRSVESRERYLQSGFRFLADKEQK